MLLAIERVLRISLVLIIVSFSIASTLTPSAEGHGVPPALQGKLVTIDDETFSSQTLQTGQEVTVQGRLVSNANTSITAWISFFSESTNEEARWEIVARKPVENIFEIPPMEEIPYELRLRALDPGVYHLHTQVNLKNLGISLAPGQTIFVMGDPINKPVFYVNVLVANIADEVIVEKIRSSSNITDLTFNEKEKRILFKISGDLGSRGTTIVPVSRLLEGPYTVTFDENIITDYETMIEQTTHETSIKLTYPEGTHKISIIGTRAIPEFPVNLMVIMTVGLIGVLVVLRVKSSKIVLR
jgi:methane/ammonia monooxygenase subunit B